MYPRSGIVIDGSDVPGWLSSRGREVRVSSAKLSIPKTRMFLCRKTPNGRWPETLSTGPGSRGSLIHHSFRRSRCSALWLRLIRSGKLMFDGIAEGLAGVINALHEFLEFRA
jgi:hypothetical protein